METTNSARPALTGRLTIPSRLTAYLRLMRLPNCLMIGLAVLVGETIGLGSLPPLREAAFGFLAAFLLLAGTMVLNDIQDVNIDRINSPCRPLPSGKLTISEAYGFSIVLSGLAILSSFLIGPLTFLTALVALVLMVYYNTRGKKTGVFGNAVVSFNVALPFFFGGLAVSHLRPLLFIFFLLAFLANTAREVAKGIADVAGDSALGIGTIAVTKGVRSAATVAAGLFGLAVLLSLVAPLLDTSVSLFYFPGVVAADVGFLYSSYRLIQDQQPKTVRAVKTQVLLWMLLGLVGFVMGSSPII